MSHEVVWTETIIQEFVKEALLSEDEEKIIRMRAKDKSRIEQADAIHCEVETIDEMTKKLRVKYDAAAECNPLLPKRDKNVYKKSR